MGNFPLVKSGHFWKTVKPKKQKHSLLIFFPWLDIARYLTVSMRVSWEKNLKHKINTGLYARDKALGCGLISWTLLQRATPTPGRKKTKTKTRGVSHCLLVIYIKIYILRQKKNYENSNISPCKNIIFKKKILRKKPKSFKILWFYN